MATALTPGRFYFLESENGIEDWITDHGGDPDDIDLDQFTAEGIDWVAIEIPKGFSVQSFTGITVTASGAGGSYDERFGKRFYNALNQGIQTSLANANLIDKFAMSDRHTSGDSTVFKRYYMIIYFGTDNHVEFTDQNDNRKSYCKGVILKVGRQWLGAESLVFMVKIDWASVWRVS